jgi:hypothetical protein
MRVARVKLLLWMIAALAGTGAVACIVGTEMVPLDTGTPVAVAGAISISGDKAAKPSAEMPPLESFEPAWRLPLRRPLVDPPTAIVATEQKAAKTLSLSVRLIGTIVDGQHPRGIFLIGLSTVELRSIGDAVGGATVLAIDDNAATLRFQGETLTVHREKNPFDPTGESYGAAARASETER